jgi:hypothetical protein
MRSSLGYKIAIALAALGIAAAVLAFVQLNSKIKSMPRFVMPSTAAIDLPAGSSTLYLETRSVVDGTSYVVSDSLEYKCAVEPHDGVTISAASSNVSYSFGSYDGRSAFTIEATRAGKYTLTCETGAEGQHFVLASGGGVGSSIVIALLGMLAVGAATVLAIVTFVRRRRARASSPTR